MMFLRLTGILAGNLARFPSRFRRFSPAAPGSALRIPALVLLLPVIFFAWLFLDAFYGNILKAGFFLRRPETVFFAAVLLSWLLGFLAALMPARALFADAAEDEFLRALPVRPLLCSAARLASLVLLLLPLHLLVFLPAFVVYARFISPDPRCLAGLLAVTALAPVLPAALAASLALALRRVPSFARWAAPAEIAALAAILVILAFTQTALQRTLLSQSGNAALIFPVELALFLGRLEQALPPALWLASIFRPGEEILPLLLCLFSGGVVAAPVIAWAVHASKTDRDLRRRGDEAAKRPPRTFLWPAGLPALVFREAKAFLGRPGLVFEAVLRLLVLPAFLLALAAGGPREFTDLVAAFLSASPFFVLAAAGLFLFLLDISFLAAAGVSREGPEFGLSLMLPLDGALQLKAKFLFHLLLSLPPAALCLSLVYILFPVAPETLVCAVPGVAAYLVFSITVGLSIDLERPVFRGSPPAVRQNANTILALAAEAGALALLVAAAGGGLLLGLSPLAAAVAAVQLLIAADIALLPRLFRRASRRYAHELEA